jgi:predicted transcriptional regulator
MKAIVIGIMPQDKIRERVLSIARGEHKPKSGEPKIWFTSMRSLAEVLSIVKIAQYELPPHF